MGARRRAEGAGLELEEATAFEVAALKLLPGRWFGLLFSCERLDPCLVFVLPRPYSGGFPLVAWRPSLMQILHSSAAACAAAEKGAVGSEKGNGTVERINVVTPFGAAVFIHSKGKLLSMRGPIEALTQWNTAVANVLYGTHGHIFFPDKCLLGDLCAALRQVFGRDSVSLSTEQESILEREIASIPEDAIP